MMGELNQKESLLLVDKRDYWFKTITFVANQVALEKWGITRW
ncbi:hypothetical protein [Fructobacillus evanidus]